jgi:hypothetical protein
MRYYQVVYIMPPLNNKRINFMKFVELFMLKNAI